jgi:hypothetical protein
VDDCGQGEKRVKSLKIFGRHKWMTPYVLTDANLSQWINPKTEKLPKYLIAHAYRPHFDRLLDQLKQWR